MNDSSKLEGIHIHFCKNRVLVQTQTILFMVN